MREIDIEYNEDDLSRSMIGSVSDHVTFRVNEATEKKMDGFTVEKCESDQVDLSQTLVLVSG